MREGRIEARIKVPAGRGAWAAFWLLGAGIDTVGWPRCGEIDVMEFVGSEPRTVQWVRTAQNVARRADPVRRATLRGL